MQQMLVWTVTDMEDCVRVNIRPLLIVEVYKLLILFGKYATTML
jgi:hypothetical protein